MKIVASKDDGSQRHDSVVEMRVGGAIAVGKIMVTGDAIASGSESKIQSVIAIGRRGASTVREFIVEESAIRLPPMLRKRVSGWEGAIGFGMK